MNKLLNVYRMLILVAFLTPACGLQGTQPGTAKGNETAPALYERVLGKSLADAGVVDFLSSNNCESASPFRLCKEMGMAFWVNPAHRIETVYLYLNNSAGFAPYKGDLPYGLKYYDIMGAVEYKLKKQGVGNGGLPDEGSTPDHLHYWATYQKAGMVIIYNSASASDEDATIYAILLSA
jgi:hypothetical protein